MVRADHSSGDIKDGMPIYLGNPCGVISLPHRDN